jgi:KDO2-lipid IV(A) lauroyltransferase
MVSTKHLSEYVALRMVGALVNVLPYRTALTVGWLNARLSYLLAPRRVDLAHQRLYAVFGDTLSRADRERIAWISWRNIVFNAVEMLRVGRITPRWVLQVSDFESTVRALQQHAATGQGGIIAVSHMGNWEMAGVACHVFGIPIFNIAAQQRNPLVNAYFNELRSRPGIQTVARGSGTMKAVLRRIREGMFLAILPDVRMREEGIRVPFLGGEANLGKGMALFARHAGVPIFPCTLSRIGWARHQCILHEPLLPDPTLDKDADVMRMTLSVINRIDAAIRAAPEQWFWFNRRWVLDPVPESKP